MPDKQKPDTHGAYIEWFAKLNENKPQIENIIVEFFDGDMRKSVLGFAAFMLCVRIR